MPLGMLAPARCLGAGRRVREVRGWLQGRRSARGGHDAGAGGRARAPAAAPPTRRAPPAGCPRTAATGAACSPRRHPGRTRAARPRRRSVPPRPGAPARTRTGTSWWTALCGRSAAGTPAGRHTARERRWFYRRCVCMQPVRSSLAACLCASTADIALRTPLLYTVPATAQPAQCTQRRHQCTVHTRSRRLAGSAPAAPRQAPGTSLAPPQRSCPRWGRRRSRAAQSAACCACRPARL